MSIPGWTAVVVNYNGAAYLDACIRALEQTRPAPAEIIVIDNGSDDDSLQELHAFPRVNVMAQRENLGFAGGANVGLAAVETEIALLMNPDVEIDHDFGGALLDAFTHDARLGAVGALLCYPDSDRIQHAGGVIERPLMTTSHLAYGESILETTLAPVDVDFVTGGALGLRMAAFRAVDGFDTAFSPVYYEDVDLCVRLRDVGWNVRFDPRLRAIHHEGVTLQHSPSYFRHLHRNRIRFALKHLSGAEWRTRFVPAEIERLRYELKMHVGEGWPDNSGAAGIESLLRGTEGQSEWNVPTLFHESLPGMLRHQIDTARGLANPPTDQATGAKALGLRFLGIFRDVGLRRRVQMLAEQQRQFNETIVQALETQDITNREQTAMTLLLALDLLGHLTFSGEGRADPPVER